MHAEAPRIRRAMMQVTPSAAFVRSASFVRSTHTTHTRLGFSRGFCGELGLRSDLASEPLGSWFTRSCDGLVGSRRVRVLCGGSREREVYKCLGV